MGNRNSTLTKSPFFRPLCAAAGYVFYYIARASGRPGQIIDAAFFKILVCFLIGSVVVGFFQIWTKENLGWFGSILAVYAFGLAACLIVFGLEAPGLVPR